MGRSRSRDRSTSSKGESREGREKKITKKRRKRSPSSSSSSSSSSRSPTPPKKAPKTNKSDDGKVGKKKRKKSPSSSSSSSSSSSASSSSSDERAKKKKRKAKKKKLKKKRAKERKEKKKAKKLAEKLKKLEETVNLNTKPINVPVEIPPPSLETWLSDDGTGEHGPVMTDEQKARLSTKRPLTKEEYDARQSVIRRVVDTETGRTRLVRGEGEIIEEIVSKEKHKDINKKATKADGKSFQKKLGTNR